MAHPYLESALRLVENFEEGLAEVAASTLVTACDVGLDLPQRTGIALWAFVEQNPGSLVARQVPDVLNGLPFEAEILLRASTIVGNPEADEQLFAASMELLATRQYASHVEVQVVLAAAECVRGKHHLWLVPVLARAVHEHGGGLPEDVLRGLRDAWSCSLDVGKRLEVREFAELLPVDLDWIELMLADDNYEVRRNVASSIPSMPTPGAAIPVIDARVDVEHHHAVRAALADAKSTVIEQGERQARRAARHGRSR